MNTNKLIDLKKTRKIKTFGHSMYPVLHDGDIVYFNKVKYKNVDVNDIIIVKHKERYVTHRIVYKTAKYFITKGDNIFKADPVVTNNNIIGKVVFVKRKGEKINIENLYLIQSSFYLQEIITLLKKFRKQKIDFLFLKGLPLNQFYEKRHPRRLYSDCDVLVKQSDFQKMEKFLLDSKYIKTNISLTTGLSKPETTAVTFYKNIHGFVLAFDIHLQPVFLMSSFDMTDHFYSNIYLQQINEDFLQNKVHIKIGNYYFPILPPEYLIIYLSLHFFHHNFKGINRLEFIHKIISSEKITHGQWAYIKDYIIKKDLVNFIYPVFILLKKYYNSTISSDLISDIAPQNKIAQLVSRVILVSPVFNGESRVSAGIKRFILVLLLSPSSHVKKLAIIFDIKVWQMIWKVVVHVLFKL